MFDGHLVLECARAVRYAAFVHPEYNAAFTVVKQLFVRAGATGTAGILVENSVGRIVDFKECSGIALACGAGGACTVGDRGHFVPA